MGKKESLGARATLSLAVFDEQERLTTDFTKVIVELIAGTTTP
jgi:hypothetical protein